jgi:hypothetical protein
MSSDDDTLEKRLLEIQATYKLNKRQTDCLKAAIICKSNSSCLSWRQVFFIAVASLGQGFEFDQIIEKILLSN